MDNIRQMEMGIRNFKEFFSNEDAEKTNKLKSALKKLYNDYTGHKISVETERSNLFRERIAKLVLDVEGAGLPPFLIPLIMLGFPLFPGSGSGAKGQSSPQRSFQNLPLG